MWSLQERHLLSGTQPTGNTAFKKGFQHCRGLEHSAQYRGLLHLGLRSWWDEWVHQSRQLLFGRTSGSFSSSQHLSLDARSWGGETYFKRIACTNLSIGQTSTFSYQNALPEDFSSTDAAPGGQELVPNHLHAQELCIWGRSRRFWRIVTTPRPGTTS
jgi:hypothetical protein